MHQKKAVSKKSLFFKCLNYLDAKSAVFAVSILPYASQFTFAVLHAVKANAANIPTRDKIKNFFIVVCFKINGFLLSSKIQFFSFYP